MDKAERIYRAERFWLEDPKKEAKYKEILELYEYCKRLKIDARLEEMLYGYKICFKSGRDFVQHRYSYGSNNGCVEPAIGAAGFDYTAVDLETAKCLVKLHRKRLNRD